MGPRLEEKHWFVICNRLNCIYIHIPRTGGQSITKALFGRTPEPEFLTTLGYKSLYEKDFYNFYKFSIVRNPWDRFVSYYLKCKDSPDDLGVKILSKCLTTYGSNDFLSFCRTCQNIVSDRSNTLPVFFTSQFKFLSDGYGSLLVDFVGKFECMHNAYVSIRSSLGLNNGVRGLPRLGQSEERGHYEGYYNNESKDIVYKLFEEDCDQFGYIF